MKIELGGGSIPRGEGYVNLDIQPGPRVDYAIDFEKLAEHGGEGLLMPFDDNTVTHVYSSHCLEHVSPFRGLLHEIARVCKVGAEVEIRVPHWLSDAACYSCHKHVVGPSVVRHWCKDFIFEWWGNSPKRLNHLRTELIPGENFHEAKPLFPNLTDEQLMKLIPGCCHESRYFFDVIEG